MSPVRSRGREDEYLGERHVYEPHRTGLPPLVPYFRELWRRRGFALELARTNLHAANTDTVFGQLWLVLNPLLLAGVYYLMVSVIRGKAPEHAGAFFAQLTSGLFLYYFITGSLQQGATSITQGGRLILNTSFPKMLLTLSTVYMAFRRYLPTLIVYGAIHVVAGLPFGLHMLWMLPLLVLSTVMGLGLANIFATVQVYFRDTASFLPYLIRVGLYLSPVLWTVESLKAPGAAAHKHLLLTFSPLNPLYGILGAQEQVLVEGRQPDWDLLSYGLVWAIVLVVAGSGLMMSREREFAVRL